MTNEITQPKSHDETPAQMKQANEPAASDNDNDAAFKTDIAHSADTEAAEEPESSGEEETTETETGEEEPVTE